MVEVIREIGEQLLKTVMRPSSALASQTDGKDKENGQTVNDEEVLSQVCPLFLIRFY